jgi:hypothetical protein
MDIYVFSVQTRRHQKEVEQARKEFRTNEGETRKLVDEEDNGEEIEGR